ncbi:MAG: hypothetical protein AMXMBFR84_25810 [Candidatus Hydrogenedentota bacterium]
MRSLRMLTGIMMVGWAVLLAGFRDPSEENTKATVSDAVAPAATDSATGTDAAPAPAPTAEAKKFAFTENSSVVFTGYKEVLGVYGSHSGGFSVFEGTCDTPDGTIENLTVTVKIDATSLYSDDANLTGVLKGEGFFEIEKHPGASFTSTKIEKGADPDQYNVTGNLEIVGIAKSINFPATIKIDGNTLTTQAEFTVPRSTWNLTWNGPIADTVIKEEVLIKFDVEATAN